MNYPCGWGSPAFFVVQNPYIGHQNNLYMFNECNYLVLFYRCFVSLNTDFYEFTNEDHTIAVVLTLLSHSSLQT